MGDLFMQSSAVLSPCGLYRYRLDRQWADGPRCCFVMLNPSTADASNDDPTIRRCIGFAKREGCGGLTVVNLFAFRATKPTALLSATDPVGPDVDRHIDAVLRETDGPVIAAWGAWNKGTRAKIVRAMMGDRAKCLGHTKDGSPRHPLYLRTDAPLIDFAGETP